MNQQNQKGIHGRSNKAYKTLLTPEGIELNLTLADAGTRMSGFILDCLFIGGVLTFLFILAALVGTIDGWTLAILQIFSFFWINFYFMFFELKWQGRTPGKRATGTRVVDSQGGPLGADAIVARNIFRDVEVILPIAILFSGHPNMSSGVLKWIASIWALVLLFWPLLNKERRRIGDLVAGTIVVMNPKVQLLEDVATSSINENQRAWRGQSYQFTKSQLEPYGEYELKVLEDVLRSNNDYLNLVTFENVAQQIQAKINWTTSLSGQDSIKFLEDYYAALRADLERRRLLGKQKKDKYSV